MIEAPRIQDDGNVGIGTTTLDILGNVNISQTSSDPYLYSGKWRFIQDNGTDLIIGHD